MVSQKVIIKNPSGLHARPVSLLVQVVGQCKSSIVIVYEDKVIPAKSFMYIMAASIKCGAEIEIQCSGETEEEDLKKLVDLIESGLERV